MNTEKIHPEKIDTDISPNTDNDTNEFDPWRAVDEDLEKGFEPTPVNPATADLGALAIVRVEMGITTEADEREAQKIAKSWSPDIIDEQQDATTYELLQTLQGQLKEKGIEPPKSIFYPASETRVTISKAFPDAAVTYLDTDEATVRSLTEAGYTAIDEDMNEFSPAEDEKFDMVYLQHMPTMPAESRLQEWLNDGGVIVTDNTYNQADLLRAYTSLEEIGSATSDQTNISEHAFRRKPVLEAAPTEQS